MDNFDDLLPEEQARVKIDKQLRKAGWEIVSRNEYVPINPQAVKEALMKGNDECDYLLFIDGKAIAVIEAKRAENPLKEDVEAQAEDYAANPKQWYGLWFDGIIPLVYLANGKTIKFKNLLSNNDKYVELSEMDSPKKMLQRVGKTSEYGALPVLEQEGLRDCQYNAEIALETALKNGKKKSLAILATGSGKTYLACLASYRMLNYTPTSRVLFLVDRNNLARQTETEFSLFDRTERGQALSGLYEIKRLKKPEDIKGTIVISTIQKLYAVMTGQTISESSEDAEDEKDAEAREKEDNTVISLGDDIRIAPDYFQFIVIDECHRSIYGKWKAVLDYFSSAKVLGLTATPTPEAYAFFNENKIIQYSYDESVVDGVNVPTRVYRIITDATVHGGKINAGQKVKEFFKGDKKLSASITLGRVDYSSKELDRSIVNSDQIETVLRAYKDSIYTDLYPERDADFRYIPKTLIFAKNDMHASNIVEIAKRVFGEEFDDRKVPEGYVQKITYSCDDTDGLIRDLRTTKEFRIAVTVTLVATGTDVKPIECVLFMKDVQSDVLYTQMKGRGCRSIGNDILRELTPNASSKDCFYIVDAIGVTEHDHQIPDPTKGKGEHEKTMSLDQLLEHLSHNELSDSNLGLLRDYLAMINRRYEDDVLFGRHLDMFINDFGYSPKTLANSINNALAGKTLPDYIDPSHDNYERMQLISCLINDIKARKKLLEMQRGYVIIEPGNDKLIYSGFSKETARNLIDNFEKYINENKDTIEALRIIYNSEDIIITNTMLEDLRDRLLAENPQYKVYNIWKSYKTLNTDGSVDEMDIKENVACLTDLMQIVRYAYNKTARLTRLKKGYAKRFNLYCGQAQRELSDSQKDIMRQISEYIVADGAFTANELNEIDSELWRKSILEFKTPSALQDEIQVLSRFILKVA